MILKEQKRTHHKVELFGFVQRNTKTQTAKTAGCVKNKIGKLLLGSLVTDQLNVDSDYRRGTKMVDKRHGTAKCPRHGEYWLDAPDSPCPSCEEEEHCECGLDNQGNWNERLFEEFGCECDPQLPAPGC